MSGCLDSILLGNEVGDPLLSKASKPERHGVSALAPAAVERKFEDASLDIKLRQVADKRDIPANWTRHNPPSPERLDTFERLKIGPFCLNKGNTVTKLANHVFDERLVCDAPVPDADNDNFPEREAA